MKLSVVVVSHNMCKILPRCLNATAEALKGIEAEIIVVDTGSEDGTVNTIIKEFPEIRLITSTYSTGFSKAYNQGIRMATGEYVLLLNPNAISRKDSIKKSLDFMDQHTAAGGLGVRMVDSLGNYMPESKKILPRTWVTFFKLTGLLKQFPKSRLTENYSIYHDDEFETTETDVLSSMFMMVRAVALDTTGPLDERFTRYGANIDLSYRMRLSGFKNYYFPKTYIINIQEDDLSKFSWAHLKSFYGAMFIFAAKYFFSLPALHVKPMQELYPAYELKG